MGTGESDCLVVGAGIGGAVLALSLAKWGYRVVILERETVVPSWGRPEVLAQSTIQTFQRLGVDSSLLSDTIVPLRGLQIRDAGGGPLLIITADDLTQAGVQPYSIDPGQVRSLLLQQAQRTGAVRVERGVEVQELVKDASRLAGVRARKGSEAVEYRTHLLVGDDGTYSRVRSGLGISLRLQDLPIDFLVPSEILAQAVEPIGQGWLNPGQLGRRGLGAGLVMPLPKGKAAMALGLRRGAYEQLSGSFAGTETFAQMLTKLSPMCAQLLRDRKFPGGYVRIKRLFGHAPRYVADGAALIGDAAHPVTPIGGQGANMAVADAVALAEVAHEALQRRDCSAISLHPYQAHRWPANERSLQFSRRGRTVLQTLITLPWLAPLAPWLVRRNNRPEIRQRLLRAIATAFASDA